MQEKKIGEEERSIFRSRPRGHGDLRPNQRGGGSRLAKLRRMSEIQQVVKGRKRDPHEFSGLVWPAMTAAGKRLT